MCVENFNTFPIFIAPKFLFRIIVGKNGPDLTGKSTLNMPFLQTGTVITTDKTLKPSFAYKLAGQVAPNMIINFTVDFEG